MKFLFVVAMLCILVQVNANNYYFSSSVGNDSYTSAQARSSLTPWKSLSKLNSFFSSLKPGDSVLFKRGDVFYGSIVCKKVGQMTMPIVLSNFGSGTNAVICGLSNFQGWDYLGGGIYQSQSLTYDLTNCVLVIDGIQYAMGRSPNSGYLTYEKHIGNNAIVDTQSNPTINWANAQIVIRKNRWVVDKSPVLSNTGNTIYYGSSSPDEPTDGFGYFIQNDKRTLDVFGEWYVDTSQKKMQAYFGSRDPSTLNIQIPVIRNLVDLNECSNISFENLSFAGAITNVFLIANSQNISIKNCRLDLSCSNSITALNSKHLYIFKTSINHSLNDAITADSSSSELEIKENTIKSTGLLEGMGNNGTGGYQAIACFGNNSLIEYNVVDSTGYNAIYFGGNNSVVRHNFITNFCLIKDDGAGIYVGDWFPWVGKKIIGNIIMNGIGAGGGTSNPKYLPVEGIYVDDRTSNVEIANNTVASCAESGIKIHNAHEIQIRANILFNNGMQLLLAHDNIAPTSYIRNVQAFDNIYFSKLINQLCLRVYTTADDDVSQIGVMDSNFYARPLDDDYTILAKPLAATNQGSGLDLAKWKSIYNKDPHSKRSSKKIKEYTLNSLTSSNKIINGTFSSNISGSSCWNPSGSCGLSWDNTGQINGGSLKLSYSTATNGNTIVVINVGSVSASKNYILRYSIKGTKPSLSVGAYLRQTNSPWSNISPTKYSLATNTIAKQEVLFSSPTIESNASIVFQFNDVDGSFWLDNIELYEADVTVTRPDDFIRFEYNASKTNKVVPLNGTYISADSTVYTNTITLAPFSSAVLIKEMTQPLPLTFLSFGGKRTGNKIDVEWKTANEVNTDYFDVLRSADGIQFEKIGEVNANNTVGVFDYKFTDDNPLSGKNYYKLKQVDQDGKYSFSNVITISYSNATGMTISPNPASNAIRVSLNIGACAGAADLFIRSVSGRLIKRMSVPISSGAEILIDVSNLASGTYLLSLFCNNIISTEKFVKE